VLNGLRETVAKSEAEAEFALDKEYWVRYYLEGHSEAYGFEIAGDLDKEMRGRRGDYRVIYEEQDMVLEVEKDLKNFFEHGHETEGRLDGMHRGVLTSSLLSPTMTIEKRSSTSRSSLQLTMIVLSSRSRHSSSGTIALESSSLSRRHSS